jgi:phosphoribosyl 1,2-cyclic phosphodiesterase
LNFYSLSSGSSGNCYYLGNGDRGILIDAGISVKSVNKFLKEIDVPMNSIMGILITHNHTDHIKGLQVLTRRTSIPAFTTRKIWNSILSSRSDISGDCIREIPLQQKFHLAGFEIESFPVSHDAPETIGFQICAGDLKVTFATDLGIICQTAARYIRSANMIVIESNYDEQMLINGRYPYYLKARIKSDRGHLSNRQTAEFLAEVFNHNMSNICLAHLSKNNNTPETALKTMHQVFFERGITLNERQRISVLNRNTPTEMITLTVTVVL